MSAKLASIIIVTRNRLGYSKLCLDSILAKTLYRPYEIIVVDNHSTDGTVEWLQSIKRRKLIKEMITLPKNYGAAYAVNLGLKKAKGDYLIRSDNDMVYNKGWLKGLVQALEAIPRSVLQVAVYGELVADGITGGFSAENQYNGVVIRECEIGGCNMAFTRKAYLELGSFPVVMVAEDSLFCAKARELGYVIGQINQATGTHVDHPACSLSKRYTDYAEYRMEVLENQQRLGVDFLSIADQEFYEKMHSKGQRR